MTSVLASWAALPADERRARCRALAALARREKMDAANVDLKGFTDEFYVKLTGAQLAARARHARLPRARDRRAGSRSRRSSFPGRTIRTRRCARVQWIARELGPRRAAALHRVPSRLQDDGPAAHAARDAHARAADRASKRACSTSTPATSTTREGGTTFCPSCRSALVVRDWHRIENYRLTPRGIAPSAARAIAGRFEAFDSTPVRRRQFRHGGRIPVCALARRELF